MIQVYIVTGSIEDILATESWSVRAFLNLDRALALCKELNEAVTDLRERAAAAGARRGMIRVPIDIDNPPEGMGSRTLLQVTDTRGLDEVTRGNRPEYDVHQCELDEDEPEHAITVPTGKKAIQL